MSEIGVIGAIYEDRRTKKQGKLIERDEKYKTLLMEASDGKSFNITFGGFKSNWRKIDEPEQTLEEAMQEVIPEEQLSVSTNVEKPEPVKKTRKKNTTKKPIVTDVNEVLENTVTTLVEFVDSFSNPKMKLNTVLDKKSLSLIIDGRKLFEVIYATRLNRYTVCVKEELAVKLNNKSYIDKIVFHEKWISTKYAFHVDVERFSEFLDDIRDDVVTKLSEEE